MNWTCRTITCEPEMAHIAPVALIPESLSIERMLWETSEILMTTPSLIASIGVGMTAALTSSQPRGVGSTCTALMQLEPTSIPRVVSLPKSELNTCPNYLLQIAPASE